MNTKLIYELMEAIKEHERKDDWGIVCIDVDEIKKVISRHAKPTPTEDGTDLCLPWVVGNTSDDQVMFLDSKERYAGGVTIRQFQGRGAYDEPRRKACAAFILEAVNNYTTPAPCPKGEKEPLEDIGSPTICYACDTSNGKS